MSAIKGVVLALGLRFSDHLRQNLLGPTQV